MADKDSWIERERERVREREREGEFCVDGALDDDDVDDDLKNKSNLLSSTNS